MKIKIDKKDCYKKDLKIPRGYRLIVDWEVLKEFRTNKEMKELLINTYCWCKIDKKVGAVRFGDNDVGFHVDGDEYFDYGGGLSRGVFVKIGSDEK